MPVPFGRCGHFCVPGTHEVLGDAPILLGLAHVRVPWSEVRPWERSASGAGAAEAGVAPPEAVDGSACGGCLEAQGGCPAARAEVVDRPVVLAGVLAQARVR